MHGQPLDELYFQWLYGLVADPQKADPAKTYWNLLRKLYQKEFVWFVPNDDNRAEDGRELRYEFMSSYDVGPPDHHWLEMGCSFLEMLIGLSRRLEFEGGSSAAFWFWHLLRTLELGAYSDKRPLPAHVVDDIVDMVVWRTYRPDGQGGLFPLRDPQHDQRKLEIWYQLNAYLLEND